MRAGAFALVPVLVVALGFEAACQPAAAPLAPAARLASMWQAYTERYVRPSGEVVDPLRGDKVSSEAQSYALVRAVWMRDRATFARVHAWTDTRLRRPDGLYSWLWDTATQRVEDANTATDGDIDIALALAMASVVFEHPPYAAQARDVVRAIRRHASVPVGAHWFPSAGNWAGSERIVNLSYFYPYASAWFERLDPGVGWSSVDAVGYRWIDDALAAGPAALPADFNQVGPDGRLQPLPASSPLGRLFSYDAIRIVWRLDAACRLERDTRACELAASLVARLAALHRRDGGFVTQYEPDGRAVNRETSLSFYGAFLPAFMRHAPDLARLWRTSHLDDGALDTLSAARNRYYDANWVWFGLLSASGLLEERVPRPEQLRHAAGRETAH